MPAGRAILGAALAALLAQAAFAGDIRFRRGMNLDIWIEWLGAEEMVARDGFLTPFPDWKRHVPMARIARLKDEGFDFIRLPIDPSPLLAMGPGVRQDSLIAETRATVEDLLEMGFTVIVDLHSVPRPGERWGSDDLVGDLWQDHLALVERMGRALHGLPPDRVAFEPLNEPTNDCAAVWEGAEPIWPPMLKDMYAAARRGTPDLPLVLSGACWGGVEALKLLDPATLGDDNVIWSFHSYHPFQFSHQGAVWTYSPLKHISGMPYPPSRLDDRTALRIAAEAAGRMIAAEGTADAEAIAKEISDYRNMGDDFVTQEIRDAVAWADAHGIPRHRMLLGEFGALRSAHGTDQPPEWQRDFLTDKRIAAEMAGIGWAVWNFAGDMGLASDTDPDRAFPPETCAAMGLTGCAP